MAQFNNSQSGNSSSGSSGTTSSNGISENGNTITLDLTNSTFSELNNPGDFVNLTYCRYACIKNIKLRI